MNVRQPGGPRRRSAFTARLQNSAHEGEQPMVLDDMRDAILRGDEPPGTAIPIDAVSAFFGVSQIPVREALKILLGEGLVEHIPHVGYSVAKLTFVEFRELYEVRRALEAAALRAACPLADADDDARVLEAATQLASSATSPGDQRYHSATRRFHLALMQPSGMKRLMQMYESAWNLTEPARPMSRVGTEERDRFAEDHRRMAAAFLARDIDMLLALSREHYVHLDQSIEGLANEPDIFRSGD